MSKPNYRVQLTFDPDRKLFLARAPELEHCTAEGASRAEAIGKLEEEIDAQLANMLSHGSTPPKSVDEEDFTGEIHAKVSKVLHRDLAFQARSEGIELDQLVSEVLAAGMEGRKQTHRAHRGGNRVQAEHGPSDNIGNRSYDGSGGPPRRQGGFGGRGANNHLLDDRASFIEYVRGLEQAPQGHGGGGHGARGGHGGGGHSGGPGGGGDNRRRRGRGGQGRSNGGGGGFRNDRPQHAGGPNGGGGPRNGNPQAHAAPPAAAHEGNAGAAHEPNGHEGGGSEGNS